MQMCKTILLQIWFLIRSLIDNTIDYLFRLMIYDDSHKKVLPKVKNPLVLESAMSLARKIRTREVTAEEVTKAFIERVEQVNPIINSVVDERFDLALAEAKEVDEFLKKTTDSPEKLEKEKPFLGIPFTTKESTSCEGLNNSFGLMSRKDVKGKEDAEVVRLMKEAGGILLGVTNMPELNLWCESRNNLYGQTLNPYNTTRTVGGSSGGEASIITACGSPIGIGTDIGGSIRMPAFFCGIFGHKPTTDLTPMKGTTRRTGKEKNTMATAGPMAKHHEDLLPFLKVLAKDNLSSVTLDEEVDIKQINFYYLEDPNDPRVSKVQSELTQALRRVVNYCQEASGKSCRKVKLDGMQYSYKLWRYWMTKEPYQFEDELGNRERRVNLFAELPKKLIGKSEFTLAAIFKLIDHYLPQEDSIWAELTTEKLRAEISDILQNNGVLLCPSSPTPAAYHYAAFFRPFNFAYWAIFNVLKLPVTQVPLGLTKDGLPMGIQVVAGLNKDHLCLAVAKEIEDAFGGWVPPFPKSKFDHLAVKFRRFKTQTKMQMCKTILLQIWFLIRSLIDNTIDYLFRLMIYDDSHKKVLPKVKNPLVLESAMSLARKIRTREVTAEEVMKAFIERVEQVNSIINSVVDQRFDLALAEAKEVDEFLKKTTDSPEKLEKEKPFLGIPFTTKDSTSCKGLNLSFGLTSRKGVKGEEDAEVVRLMKEAGGILLGITNMPELNLWCESRNNLYGQTLNPYNTTRTVGGSSGGDASIITACGSPIAIGTDIGGSIRMPAFFCGIFGHKPTTDLTPMKGIIRRTGKEKNSMATAGPMAKHHEDLLPFLKVLAKDNLSSVTLDEEVDIKQINFYYLEDPNDPRVSKVQSELTQALRRVVNYCQEASGKSCRKVKLDGMQYSYKLWRYWMTKEPHDFAYELGNRERRVNLLVELPKKLIGKSEFTLAAIFNLIDQYLPQEDSIWAELTTEKLRAEISDILQNNGVLLCPSSPTPATYHYAAFFRPFNFAYWAIFNVLKLPVTQVPLGLTKDGLPMGIQVVAGLNKDHLCLAVAKEIEDAFGGWVPPFPVD